MEATGEEINLDINENDSEHENELMKSTAPLGKLSNDVDIERANEVLGSGILEGYEYILKNLCKSGLPKGNCFEYASIKMLQFEAKWNTEMRLREKFTNQMKDLKLKPKEKEARTYKSNAMTRRARKFAKQGKLAGSTEVLIGKKNNMISKADIFSKEKPKDEYGDTIIGNLKTNIKQASTVIKSPKNKKKKGDEYELNKSPTRKKKDNKLNSPNRK